MPDRNRQRIMRFIEVPRVDYEKLSDDRPVKDNLQVRVEAEREWYQQRFANPQILSVR
jgi:hypothetical protein